MSMGNVLSHSPDEMLEETGWDVGTELDWSEEIDGSIILKEILE